MTYKEVQEQVLAAQITVDQANKLLNELRNKNQFNIVGVYNNAARITSDGNLAISMASWNKDQVEALMEWYNQMVPVQVDPGQ